jgi:large subunit ribosomal protein L25
MIAEFKLIAKERDTKKDKLSELRKNNFVPGVVYGNKLAPQLLYFDKKQAEFLEESAGKAIVIPLFVEGDKSEKHVIIQDLQHDKIDEKLLHIDLYAIDMQKEVKTEIPLELKGVSLAVKDMGGTLVKNMEEISIKCLPVDLPEKIVVDISVLKTFDDLICIKDLEVPAKIEVFNNPEDIVAKVSEPRSEEEIEELEESVEGDVSQVEGVADAEKEGEEGEEGGKKTETEEKAPEAEKETEEKTQKEETEKQN